MPRTTGFNIFSLGPRRLDGNRQLHLLRLAEVLASILGSGSQLLLNPEDLVVLGQTLRAARSSSLDL